MKGLRAFAHLVSKLATGIRALSINRLVRRVVHRDNVVHRVCNSAAPRKVDQGRGIRRLMGNTRSFMERHGRRNGNMRMNMTSCLRRMSLLDSVSRSSDKRDQGLALVAIRSTGKLRFPIIFMMKLRRRLFPDTVTNSDLQRVRRRHHLFCMTLAETRGRYVLAFTHDQFEFNGARFNGPDHFLSRVSDHCLEFSRGAPTLKETAPVRSGSGSNRGQKFCGGGVMGPGQATARKRASIVLHMSKVGPLKQTILSRGGRRLRDSYVRGVPSSAGIGARKGLRINDQVVRRHFNRNIIGTLSKGNRGTGTAISFVRAKAGRLLLHFTHFQVIRWSVGGGVGGVIVE